MLSVLLTRSFYSLTRHLTRHVGNEIFIPELRLDEGYGVAPMDTLHVYNKG